MNEEKVLDIKEMAKYLKCSVSTIRNLIRAHKIPHFRNGTKIYFILSSIERWLEENERY